MIRAFDAVSLPLLRWFDPEDAHRMAIQGLRLLPPIRQRVDDPKLAVRAFGLNFPIFISTMAVGVTGPIATLYGREDRVVPPRRRRVSAVNGAVAQRQRQRL